MFYRADEPHGLPHNPFKAIVAPRPIGWISTVSKDGAPNLAPYSFFNAIGDAPMMVMFSSAGMKDSIRNARETGVFTANFVSHDMKDAMNVSSSGVEAGVNEFDLAGLTMLDGRTVACPRVAGVPAALECAVTNILQPDTLEGGKSAYLVVIGQVRGVFIDDDYLKDGRFDLAGANPIMRAGYRDYMGAGQMFELNRPEEG